jgi:preprotein translocase subunit SecY
VLGAFANAFKTPDLRRKILFVLFIVVIFRIGSVVPAPGVNVQSLHTCIKISQGGANANLYNLINLFSGGALLQLAIFALGIMPYITASIILQLLTVVIPRLESLKKEGQAGQAKITQYTRFLTVGLAILQSTAFVALARTPGRLFQGCTEPLLYKDDWFTITVMVLTMTAGTGVIMWLGELITDRGVGNGMSILIFTQIVATFPTQLWNIRKEKGIPTFVVVIAIGLVIMAAVIFIEQAQRRIPVQYAKRMVGRKMFGGTSTYIPLKVNQAGVIPVIFASSLLYLPQLVAQLAGSGSTNKVIVFINRYITSQSNWVHILLYFALIIFFTYFYVAITFNPTDVSDNMRKHGGFVPGIRPGRPTAEYLDFILSRITLPGSLYLGIIAVLPNLFMGYVGGSNTQSFPFGGTAVLIMVGVGLDTVKQIESQLMQRNYEGFLR